MSDNAHGEHISPILDYLKVYGALLVLTVVTVAVSFMGFGPLAIYVAMAVAIVKATLVVAIFMHLKWDARLNLLVFLMSIVFMAIFFGFTALDLGFRDGIHREQANHLIQTEADDVAREDALAKAAADAALAAAEATAPADAPAAADPAAAPAVAPTAAPAPAAPSAPVANPWALPATP